MKLQPMDMERNLNLRRRADGTRGRHVRTVAELADEFGVTYQSLTREMQLRPDGVPRPVESHSSARNGYIKRYDLLLMRAWWRKRSQ